MRPEAAGADAAGADWRRKKDNKPIDSRNRVGGRDAGPGTGGTQTTLVRATLEPARHPAITPPTVKNDPKTTILSAGSLCARAAS